MWKALGKRLTSSTTKARQQAPLLQLLQRVCQSSACHQLLRCDVQQLQAGPLLAQLLRKLACVSLCTPGVSLYLQRQVHRLTSGDSATEQSWQ